MSHQTIVEIQGLPVGTYQVKATTQGPQQSIVKVTIKDGEERKIPVRVEAAGVSVEIRRLVSAKS